MVYHEKTRVGFTNNFSQIWATRIRQNYMDPDRRPWKQDYRWPTSSPVYTPACWRQSSPSLSTLSQSLSPSPAQLSEARPSSSSWYIYTVGEQTDQFGISSEGGVNCECNIFVRVERDNWQFCSLCLIFGWRKLRV